MGRESNLENGPSPALQARPCLGDSSRNRPASRITWDFAGARAVIQIISRIVRARRQEIKRKHGGQQQNSSSSHSAVTK